MVRTAVASKEEPREEEHLEDAFGDKVLDELLAELVKRGVINQGTQDQPKTAAQESSELLSRYEQDHSDPYYSGITSLQDTAKKLTALTQQIDWQRRVEESPVLTLYDRAKKSVLKTIGRPDPAKTSQELTDEKMLLVDQYKQEMISTKDKVGYSWNQLVDDKRHKRGMMVAALNTHSGLEQELASVNELYEGVSQQLESTRKTDPNYQQLADAKDELRRRIELLKLDQQKSKQDIVYNRKKVSALHNHEGVMLRMLAQLESSANATSHSLEMAYIMQGVSAIYREGKTSMEIIDSMDKAAIKFMDIEKETRELSDVVLRASVKGEQNSARIGRLGSTISRYKGMLSAAAENNATSLDQEANDIINSYGE